MRPRTACLVSSLWVLAAPACQSIDGDATTSTDTPTTTSTTATLSSADATESPTTRVSSSGDDSGDGGSTSGDASTSVGTTTGGTTAGSSSTGELDPTMVPIGVAVLGASTAVGWNLDVPKYGGEVGGLKYSWVNRYAAYLDEMRPGSVVHNLSKAGYGTYEALPTGTVSPADRPKVDTTRNITAALATDPDVVVIHYPSGGDLDNGIQVSEIIANLEVIAATAAAADVAVWVTTPNPLSKTSPAKIDQFLDMRAQILTVYGDHALDFWAPRVGPDGNALPEYTLLDGHHPNAEGHRLLFELVVAAQIPEATLASK